MLKLYEIQENEEVVDSYQHQRNKGVVQIRRKEREETFMKRRKVDILYEYAKHVDPPQPNQNQIHPFDLENQQTSLNTGDQPGLTASQSQSPVYSSEQSRQRYSEVIADDRYREQILEFSKVQYTIEMLQSLVYCLQQEEALHIMYGAMGLRKLLSKPDGPPPVQEIIDTGVVPYMLTLITLNDYPQIQMEVIWCLTNIAAGSNDQSKSIVENGGITLLISVLKSTENIVVVEQVLWALGNLSADSNIFRDMIINEGGIEAILNITVLVRKVERLVTEVCWCIANLCRGLPLPEYDRIKELLPILCIMISIGSIQDQDTLSDCLWAISYHCEAMKNKGEFVLQSNMLERLMPMLIETTNYRILMPGVRIVGQLSTGSFKYTDLLMNKYNVLGLIDRCIRVNKKIVRREACWVLSNLTAGPFQHIRMILQRQSMIQQLLLMFTEDSLEVRKEICYIFANMTYGGRAIEMDKVLIKLGVFELYVELLENSDQEYILEVLETLESFLRLGQTLKDQRGQVNLVVEQIHRCGGGKVLERLQYIDDQKVYDKLSHILKTYFELWDPMEDGDALRKKGGQYVGSS